MKKHAQAKMRPPTNASVKDLIDETATIDLSDKRQCKRAEQIVISLFDAAIAGNHKALIFMRRVIQMSDRNKSGQFEKDNAVEPGRPRRNIEREYLLALNVAATLDEWRPIVNIAKQDAIAGDAK